MNALMTLATATCLLGRQEEKRTAIEWWTDVPKAMTAARKELKPLMLYFRTARQFEPGYSGFEREGSTYDSGVVEAGRSFVLVWVDCDSDVAARKKFGMEGRNSDLLFLDPFGKESEVARSHKPRELEAQMRGVAKKWEWLRTRQDPFDWLQEKVRDLGDSDIEVRERATQDLLKLHEALSVALSLAGDSGDPEVRSRARYLRGDDKPSCVDVPVMAHSVQKVGPVEVEFGCVTAEAIWGATIKGVEYVKVEVVGDREHVRPFVEREKLPGEFGFPKALRIYPRGK